MILVEHHGFPIVHVNLYFRIGPAFDPPGKEGLTSLTNRVLIRGTESRGRAEIEEAVEGLGSELLTSTQNHAVGLGGTVLRRNLEAFLAIVGEVLTKPKLATEEVDKVRREMAAELEAARDEDSQLARMWFRRLLYPGHPFGHGSGGTAASLAAITPEDVRGHYKRYYTRANLVASASGDVTQVELDGLLDKALAGLAKGEAAPWKFPELPERSGRQVALIDKADRSQVQILIGHPAIDAKDPDVYALGIATTAFGGTFTARLMQEVRVKRGLSYGAYARLSTERMGGYYMLTAAPETKDAVATLELLFSEYSRFVKEGLTDEEIGFGRDYAVQAFPFSVDSASQLAVQRVRAHLLERPADYVDTYVERLKGTTNEQVRDAVRRRLTPDDLLVIMVCTAPPLRDAVAKLPGVKGVRVIPYSEERW